MTTFMRAAVLLGSSMMIACDALLVEPRSADSDPPVRLSLAAALHGGEGDYSNVLGQVEQVRVTLASDGGYRDTVVVASFVNGELLTLLRLRGDEAVGMIQVAVDLTLGTGESLFTGQAVVETGVIGPQVHVPLEPVASSLSVVTLGMIESLGGVTPLDGVAYFATGDEIVDAEIGWTSSAPEIFEILPGAAGIARANGEVQVTALFQGFAVPQQVRVRQIPWGLSGIAPVDTTISVGQSFQIRIQGTDALGSPLQSGAGIWWFVPSVGVIGLGPEERVTGLAPGQAEIQANYLDTDVYRTYVTVIP